MGDIQSVKFPAGAVVFKEGDAPDGVYFIGNGAVEIFKNQGGKMVSLAKLGKDSVFGEMALIDNKPRSATVKALVELECYKGSQASFKTAISNVDPVVKAAMEALVAVVREKNQTPQVAGASGKDALIANSVKAKGDKIKKEQTANAVLQQKVAALDPFMASLYRALLAYL